MRTIRNRKERGAQHSLNPDKGKAAIHNNPCQDDWSTCCLSQHLGTRNSQSVEQDDEEESGVPRLCNQTRSRNCISRSMRLELWDVRNHGPTLSFREDLQAAQL